jgi:hypothetical protein
MSTFGSVSVEEISEGVFIWHVLCHSCKRTTRVQEDLSERNETQCLCSHCKTKLNIFSSFKTIFRKFFPLNPPQENLLPHEI